MSDDAWSYNNQFAAQQHVIVERLQFFLASLHNGLHADVLYVLETESKILAVGQKLDGAMQIQQIIGTWPLLTFITAQMIQPQIDQMFVGIVAVATECFICALDLLDDVEDDDSNPIVQTLGVARTLNVSTTLLMLAQQALLSLSRYSVPAERILLLLDTLQVCALAATNGQHKDILAEKRPARDFTQEDCIEIARGKAGSLMKLAFLLGAICADADERTREELSVLGELLGIAHQLDNDAHDLYYLLQGASSSEASNDIPKSKKTDLTRGKKTLPIVLAAQSEKNLQGNAVQADEQKQEQQSALQAGIITTWGMYLLYRERAREKLREIEIHVPASSLLRLLLDL